MSLDGCNRRQHKFITPREGGRYTSKGIKIAGSGPIAMRSR
ncbi:hypothetical protein [Laspinema olomoucense]|nr:MULTISPECIES: hypothetical protein [unclassified Laspinema]